jgi:hypothetical protein
MTDNDVANGHGTSIARPKAGNKQGAKQIDACIQRSLSLKGVSGTTPMCERLGVPEFFAACQRDVIMKILIQDETRLAPG